MGKGSIKDPPFGMILSASETSPEQPCNFRHTHAHQEKRERGEGGGGGVCSSQGLIGHTLQEYKMCSQSTTSLAIAISLGSA